MADPKIRVSRTTRDELRRLALAHQQTVAETVTRGVQLLRQDDIGRDLAVPLSEKENNWLNADAG